MTSPQARKGSQYERDVVAQFQAWGFEAERCYGAGRPEDVGDIELAGIPVVIEAKNCVRYQLSEWVEEARLEAENAGVDVGVVVVKVRGKPAYESYMVCRLDDGAELLRAYGESVG